VRALARGGLPGGGVGAGPLGLGGHVPFPVRRGEPLEVRQGPLDEAGPFPQLARLALAGLLGLERAPGGPLGVRGRGRLPPRRLRVGLAPGGRLGGAPCHLEPFPDSLRAPRSPEAGAVRREGGLACRERRHRPARLVELGEPLRSGLLRRQPRLRATVALLARVGLLPRPSDLGTELVAPHGEGGGIAALEHLPVLHPQGVGVGLELPLARDEQLLHALVEKRPEELLEELLPVRGLGHEQPLEIPLRQQHDLRELLHLHAEEGLDPCGDGIGSRRQRGGRPLPPEARGGRLLGEPGPPLLRPLPRRRALDPVDRLAHPEPVGHGERHVGRCAVGAKAIVPPRARDHAVERKGDGVEEGRLARSGLAVDEEEVAGAEGGEVDGLPFHVRPEGLELEVHRPHASTPFLRTSSRAWA
jgi:hypothetical protein